MKKIFSVCGMVILVLLVSPLSSIAAETIKVGLIQSLSGGVGQLCGSPDLIATKIAIEEINQTGGILGRRLEVIPRDDKLSAEAAVRQAKDLILNEKVHWIQGVTSGGVALAVSAYCREQKVLFFASAAATSTLTEEKGHRYLFHTNTTGTCYTRSVANGVFKFWPGLKKIFIMNPDYEFGHKAAKEFMEDYVKLVPEAKVIGELWPKLGTTDFTPYVAKIMQSGCDLLYSEVWGGDLVSFTRVAWGYGFFDKMKMAGAVTGALEYLKPMSTTEEYPKGALGVAFYPFWLIDNPLSNAFAPKFKKESGDEPGSCAAFAYSTVYAMKHGIEKAGSLETEKIIKALEGLEYDSVVGRLKIRPCDHQTAWPTWVGLIKRDSKHPWPYVGDAFAMDPEKCIHTCAEVETIRKQQR